MHGALEAEDHVVKCIRLQLTVSEAQVFEPQNACNCRADQRRKSEAKCKARQVLFVASDDVFVRYVADDKVRDVREVEQASVRTVELMGGLTC